MNTPEEILDDGIEALSGPVGRKPDKDALPVGRTTPAIIF